MGIGVSESYVKWYGTPLWELVLVKVMLSDMEHRYGNLRHILWVIETVIKLIQTLGEI
jgi:hypothetical protein